jgi:hypothetical protein
MCPTGFDFCPACQQLVSLADCMAIHEQRAQQLGQPPW